jgi:regulator of sigma E protease
VAYAIDFATTPLKTLIKGNDPLQAISLGLRQTWNMIKMVYVTIQRVAFTRTIGVKQLSGPIYIIHQGKMVAEAGFNQLLYYLALISANLAVINFLPIPVVDGGLMIILFLEKVRGKMLSPRATAIWQGVGLSLIVALFLFVTYNDVLKLIRGQ